MEQALNLGLGSIVSKRAWTTPDRPAITFEGKTQDYRTLANRFQRLAADLLSEGITPGARVAYLGTNHPLFLETMLAASCIGAVFVPVNFRLSGPELAYIINDADVHTLVADQERSTVIEQVRDQLSCQRFIGVDFVSPGWESVNSQIHQADPIGECVPVDADDLALIMYTSGTTGHPKGAMLTHGNLFWNNINIFMSGDELVRDVSLTCAPLFHVGGLNVTTALTLQKGAHLVLNAVFDSGQVLHDLEHFRVRTMWGAPAMYRLMTQHPDFATTDLSSVDLMVCGGAPVPESLILAYKDKGVRLCQGYGLTETSSFATFLSSDLIETRLGSAGAPPVFGDICIKGTDGKVLPANERGEVCVRGPMVLKGYWNLAEATREAIDDAGWLRTGDVGYLDREGYLFLCDRLTDVVISGGENVYPAEVEKVLCEHPAIRDVAVIGLAHDKWGEAVTAIVELHDEKVLELADLRDFAGAKLARYKLPLGLHVLAELPRNPAGKVLKYRLREMIARNPSIGLDHQPPATRTSS